jgi:hypothetical protein
MSGRWGWGVVFLLVWVCGAVGFAAGTLIERSQSPPVHPIRIVECAGTVDGKHFLGGCVRMSDGSTRLPQGGKR